MKIKKVHIIINPASGKREPILPVINEGFKDSGIEWDVSVTKAAGDDLKMAREAVKKGIDILAVYGGDGTVQGVLEAVIESKLPLAILPGGTANVMSKELGIPQELMQACELITKGKNVLKTIDLGRQDKRYFMLRTGIGFESEMVKGADRETKNRFGRLAYTISAVKAFKNLQNAVYEIIIDGQKHKAEGLTCIIANSSNMGFGDISFNQNVDVSDGLLDVLVVRRADFKLLAHVIATLLSKKGPENWEVVSHWQGKDIAVESKPVQAVQCDGETLPKGPLKAKIAPAAVQVLVPRT